MINKLDLEIALASASIATSFERQQPIERAEWLSRLAGLVSERQIEIMEWYKRGWFPLIVNTDNRVRSIAGLSQYMAEASPVKAYVDLVSGNDVLFSELVRRINQQFGEESAEEFFRITTERASRASHDRSRNAPPEHFTHTLFRLDDARSS